MIKIQESFNQKYIVKHNLKNNLTYIKLNFKILINEINKLQTNAFL